MATDQPQTNPFAFTAVDTTDNPLKTFRSYSYHFILMAMDTTEYLDLGNPSIVKLLSTEDFYTRPTSGRRNLITDDIGNRIILIDTRIDTDYIIEDVEWGTAFIGLANSSDSTSGLNTYLTDGQMTIIEPRGVKFITDLADICSPNKLNNDPCVMPFLMKVIFLGHADDGTVQPVYNVPPFGIFFSDISGSIDANGTTYHIKYAGSGNGVAAHTIYNGATDGIQFEFRPDRNLSGQFEYLNTAINHTYQNKRAQIIQDYKKAGIDLSKACDIKWNISIEGATADNPFGTSERFSKLHDFGKLRPDHCQLGNGYTTYQGSKDGGVTELISVLFESCSDWTTLQLTDDFKTSTDMGVKYAFKITTTFDKGSPTKGNNVITINYIVSEYSYYAQLIDDSQKSNSVPPVIPPEQTLTFDYIFTGKNIDISHLDMNLSVGSMLWTQLVTAQALPTQFQDINGTIGQSANISQHTFQGSLNPDLQLRTGTPIWPPAMPIPTLRTKEFTQQAQVSAADAIWRNYVSLQAVKASMTILGNPKLIQKITLPGNKTPNYVKINVKMPFTKDDIWEYYESNNLSQGGYYENFWFDGYFMILFAKNKFLGGQFTQELDLAQIPQYSNDMINNPGFTPPAPVVYATLYEQAPGTLVAPNLSIVTATLDNIYGTNPLGLVGPGSRLSSASSPTKYTQFVQKFRNDAVTGSQQAAQTRTGAPIIDPNFLLAQAAVESGWGTYSLASCNNLSGLTAQRRRPHNVFWDGSKTIPGTGVPAGFCSYTSSLNGFGDHAVAVTRLWSGPGIGAYGSTIEDYAQGLCYNPTRECYTQSNTPAEYYAAIVAAYADIQLANSLNSPPITSSTQLIDMSAIPPPSSPNPFLSPNTAPTTSQTPAEPTTYSGLDRLVVDAMQAQKLSPPVFHH